jgi:nucleoside-diphosphate-sugar epimerase
LRQKECGDSERAWTVNYYSTLNLANLCVEHDIKLIFASSCSIYGVSNELAIEETVPLPISTYARTKVCAEKPVLEAGGVVLRFATAYGGSPCMRKDLIMHQFLSDAMRGKIVIYDPDACRAIVHVKDIARAILLSVQTDLRGQIFNIGGGNYSKGEMARIICKHLPKTMVEEVLRGDVRDYRVSFEKAHNVLGFVPRHDLDKWVEETCRFLKHGD